MLDGTGVEHDNGIIHDELLSLFHRSEISDNRF
jgi:hypothetical protein